MQQIIAGLPITGGTLTGDLVLSSTGARLPNAAWLRSRNAAGTADLNLIRSDSSDQISVGNGAIITNSSSNVGIGVAPDTDELVLVKPTAGKHGIYVQYTHGNGGGSVLHRQFGNYVQYRATDVQNVNAIQGMGSTIEYGGSNADTAANGTVQAATFDVNVRNTSDDLAEHAALFLALRYYDTITANAGRAWLADTKLMGPIGVQPHLLTGFTIFMNNHYDGQPSDTTAGGSCPLWIQTRTSGGGQPWASSSTYPLGVGLGIVGTTTGGNRGYNTGIQLGGAGGPWASTSSRFGTGIDLRDFDTYGVRIHTRLTGTTGPAISVANNGGEVVIGSDADGRGKFDVTGTVTEPTLGGVVLGPQVNTATTGKAGIYMTPAMNVTGAVTTVYGSFLLPTLVGTEGNVANTVTNYYGLWMRPDIAANFDAGLSNLIGIQVQNSTKNGSGGVNNHVGIQVESPTRGTTNKAIVTTGTARSTFGGTIEAGAGGIATLVKAGAVSDADFASAPPSGTIAVDTTNSLLYVRVGSTWKTAALA